MLRFHIVESKKFDQKAVGDKFYRTNIYGEAIFMYNSNICERREIMYTNTNILITRYNNKPIKALLFTFLNWSQ